MRVKKYTVASLLLVFMVAAGGPAGAEPARGALGPVRLGGKLGPGIVTWAGADADGDFLDTVGKLGFSASAFANIGVSALFGMDTGPVVLSIQPELSYAAKGAGIEIDGGDAGVFRSSHLSLALLPRVAYAVTPRLIPYMVIGPALGLLLDAEIENRLGTVTNIEDDFTSTDLGLMIGLGADVPIAAYGSLVFELRADLGLTSIDGQGDGDDIKNRAYSFMVGYQY